MERRIFLSLLAVFVLGLTDIVQAQKQYNEASTGNPLVPGYYADPTIRKFGDTYYIYATTDGTGGGKGPSQVWVSKDFVNWTLIEMNWPTTPYIWAPEVIEKDGKYYFYYSEPCMIYGGVADSPLGPWKNLQEDGFPLIKDAAIQHIITLDGQTFLDDDGKRYIYFGTWGIYKDSGCGVFEVGEDMKTMSNPSIIPNTEATDFFEAPYMIKKDGIYYFTYSSGSCHDHTYRVQYATSTTGPRGPFVFADNNPILATNEDETIHGPGHHSLIEINGEWYIVYHRHDNPHSGGGMYRQLAADKLEFGQPGEIKKIVPTHDGVGYLGKNVNPFPNMALNKPVKVSSYVDENYRPSFAVDDNNGTCWFPGNTNQDYWIEVDLEELKNIRKIETDFRYGTLVYQYLIEYSTDGKNWNIFSDKRNNLQSGSPMTDFGNVKARYLRLTVTGEERPGFSGIWRFRVFEDATADRPQLLVHLSAEELNTGKISYWANQRGMYGKGFRGDAEVKIIDGKKAVSGSMTSAFVIAPSTLAKGNPYTIAAEIHKQGKWQHIAFVNDGKRMTVYIDGRKQKNSKLKPRIRSGEAIHIGNSDQAILSGDIASLRLYSRALFPSEIQYLLSEQPEEVRIAKRSQNGAVVDLDIASLSLGSSASVVKNKGFVNGSFTSAESAPIVDMVQGRKALVFDGKEMLISDFKTPESLSANSTYTVSAWVYNPEISKNEAILEWANVNERNYRGGIENEAKVFGYGSNPDNGAMTQIGYGDQGYLKEKIPSPGEWHHIAVTFDGLIERIYVDGQLHNSELKISFTTRDCPVLIGNNSAKDQPFSGAIASLKLYNTCLSDKEILAEATQKSNDPIGINLNASSLIPGELTCWENAASWLDRFNTTAGHPIVDAISGKLSVLFDGKSQMTYRLHPGQIDNEISLIFVLNTSKRQQEETVWAITNNSDVPVATYKLSRKGCTLEVGERKFQSTEEIECGKWIRVAVTIDPEKIRIYRNDRKILEANSPGLDTELKEIILGGMGKKGYRGALAGITVHAEALSEEALLQGYREWTSTLNALPSTIAFTMQPQMITSSMIHLIAEIPTATVPVEYLFTQYENGKVVGSSGWQKDPEFVLCEVPSGHSYGFTVRVKDYYGNVTEESAPSIVHTQEAPQLIKPEAAKQTDLTEQATTAGWSGFYVSRGVEKLEALQTGNVLRMQSTKTGYDGINKDGPFAYIEVTGDFVAEVKLSDASGEKEKISHGFNEYGLIASMPLDDDHSKGMNFVSSSIFPHYWVGNLWTNMQGFGRPQGNNQSGWDFYRYVQIERSGSTLYLRYSKDGKQWKLFEKFERADLAGQPLWVGVYHSTYTDFVGYGEFTDFKLWERK